MAVMTSGENRQYAGSMYFVAKKGKEGEEPGLFFNVVWKGEKHDLPQDITCFLKIFSHI